MNEKLSAIKAGYERGFDLYCDEQLRQACTLWLKTWADVRDYARQHDLRSTGAFVAACDGDTFLESLIGDLDVGLVRACMMQTGKSISPKYMKQRLAWAQDCLELFADEEGLMRRTFRVSVAESHAFLGEPDKCNALFEEIMATDPDWILGYIFWSDRHRLGRQSAEGLEQAEAILLRGLSHAGDDTQARFTLLERLADVCRRAGRDAEAEDYATQCAALAGEAES